LLIAIGLVLWPRLKTPKQRQQVEVTDFASCQEAGGSIVDGEPVKCVAPDGREFLEAEHAEPDVVLDSPKYGDLVKSPLGVTGKARGTWFFEASLPITLKDETGKVLVRQPVQAIGDWMTVDYVNFATTLAFDPGDAQYGVLVIEKDNPSGNPDLDSQFAIPVRFK
jgi:hypothetical protein